MVVIVTSSGEGESQLPALLEYFKKLPDTDKKINSNERYKKIMVILTAPEMIVQLCFLKSIKPVFDRFLQMFQTEGPLIHVLHQAMLDLLKQVMSGFLKQSVVKGRSVNELLKVDSKNIDFQLKNDELDVGNEMKKALNDLKQSGKQSQCFIGIRSFFTTVVAYMQKSLELRNPLVEAMSYLQPEQRTKDSSLQKIRLVGSLLPCVKPEEVILLTDEWRMYAETDIPEEWIQQEGGSVVRVDHYWHKVVQLKTHLGKQKFDVLAKTVKCALVDHMGMQTIKEVCLSTRKLSPKKDPNLQL